MVAATVAFRTLLAARRQGRLAEPGAVLAALLLVTMSWVLVGNVFDSGENNRFRIVLDPLVFVTVIAWAARAVRRRSDSRAGPEPTAVRT